MSPSLSYTEGPRFIRPSEAIERLKDTRTLIGSTTADFQLFGVAEFAKALENGAFIQNDEKAALYVMCGNSSSNSITNAGAGVSEVSHAIDIVLYLRMRDARGQRADQISVWFKEYLARSLAGYEAYVGAEPLLYGGDQFVQVQNVAGYARTYQFTQIIHIDRDDLIGDGNASDLEDFTSIFNEFSSVNPDFEEIAQNDLTVDVPI